jgi:hypothetical protein
MGAKTVFLLQHFHRAMGPVPSFLGWFYRVGFTGWVGLPRGFKKKEKFPAVRDVHGKSSRAQDWRAHDGGPGHVIGAPRHRVIGVSLRSPLWLGDLTAQSLPLRANNMHMYMYMCM